MRRASIPQQSNDDVERDEDPLLFRAREKKQRDDHCYTILQDTMTALAWNDHLIRREKVLVAVFTAWLTLTVSLYVFVSSNSAPPLTTIRGTDDITHVHPKQTNPLHRTAREKFQAWANAHRPSQQHKEEGALSKSREKQRTIVQQQKPSANDIPTRQRTAKEKLAEYAKTRLQKKTTTTTTTTTTGWAWQQSQGQPQERQPEVMDTKQIPRLRKTAHEKLQAYAHATMERHKSQEETPAMTQRQKFEAQFPPFDSQRVRSFVASLRTTEIDREIRRTASTGFDPFECPDTPPPNYPWHYSLVDMLKEWPVDQLHWPAATTYDNNNINNTSSDHQHPYLYHSLCIFDWDRPEHRERMRRYQIDFDVPFVLRNQPEFVQAAERWMNPGYLQGLIGNEPQRNEHSFQSNHLPFWRTQGLRNLPSDWKAPTENVLMTYAEWSERADAMDRVVAQQQQPGQPPAHAQLDHYYFRLNAKDKHRNGYLYEELPVFDPALSYDVENLFMLHPNEERGINCRLGMAGNVAEAHYDYSSNWITLLGGHRRYILAHPRECHNLALFPKGHPSARHSSVNWSEIFPGSTNDGGSSTTSHAAEQALSAAVATQVILQASDALYLPTNWLHFIVSLDRNYQCNARSGIRTEYNSFIEECGFPLA
eukprot:scaffold12058_cov163-Amphora_coffeaeformis.AAC.2